MALSEYETSRRQGHPVFLYEVLHNQTVLRYTDGDTPITYDGEVFEPHPIKSGKRETKGGLESPELRVEVPLTSPIADLFRIFPPGDVVTLRIRQGHIASPDDPTEWAEGENFPTAWLGRVLEASREGAVCTLTCESAGAGMARVGCRRNYQWPCSLALYGKRCGANQAAATTTTTVAVLETNRVSATPGWLPPGREPEDYVGGLLTWDGDGGPERRAILRVTGSATFHLSGPVRALEVGQSIDVALGCPHTLDGCERLHNNVLNYGGHPWIPKINPVGKNNHT